MDPPRVLLLVVLVEVSEVRLLLEVVSMVVVGVLWRAHVLAVSKELVYVWVVVGVSVL